MRTRESVSVVENDDMTHAPFQRKRVQTYFFPNLLFNLRFVTVDQVKR